MKHYILELRAVNRFEIIFPFSWSLNTLSNAYNLHRTNPLPNDKFYILPNWKSLQTTISILMKMAERSPDG